LQIQGTAAASNANLMLPIPENKSIKRIFFRAIKPTVKTHILYYFLREAEPLDIHYQAEPGKEKVSRYLLPGRAW
jgi:hypothetical protein